MAIKDDQGNLHSEDNGRFVSKDGAEDKAARDDRLAKAIRIYSDDPEDDLKAEGLSPYAGKDNNGGNSSEPDTFISNSTPKEFRDTLASARESHSPDKQWRVDVHDESYYANCKRITTKGGSSVSIASDGDIVSVCRNLGDMMVRGQDLMRKAIENGGKKLDSFSYNHKFYCKCGFEPVSWCAFSRGNAPKGWDPARDKEEPVIFYRYTGKVTTETVEDFCKRVPESADYASAQKYRDKHMED